MGALVPLGLMWSFQHQLNECWLLHGAILHLLAATKHVVQYQDMKNIILVAASCNMSSLPWSLQSTA
jgi:hypothetical protein